MQGNGKDLQGRISELEAQVQRLQDLVQQQAAELRHGEKSRQALEKLATQRQHRIEELEARLQPYEPVLPAAGEAGGEEAGPEAQRYSLADEEQRQRPQKRRPKSRGGRKTLAEKIQQTQRRVAVYPAGTRPADCRFVRTRVAWRLEAGQAVVIAYDLYAPLAGGPAATVPALGQDGAYGIEWAIILASLMYLAGLSLDKARAVIRFFTGLSLGKSQADALLNRLTKDWEAAFEEICQLLACAMVVHVDESGWKVGQQGRSVWVFLSEQLCVLLFGHPKDLDTLLSLLDPETFEGTVVSDDSALYRNRFRQAQKCWAHLLRKAIRLTLRYPAEARYREFLEALLGIYRDAKRAAADKRLQAPGRHKKVLELASRVWTLCGAYYAVAVPEAASAGERAFINLNHELLRLAAANELFVFVRNPAVPATNNAGERAFRFVAGERATGRTSKTDRGAHRRSVLGSVLTSLSMQWEHFTLATLLAYVLKALDSGARLFADRFPALSPPSPSSPARASPQPARA